MDMALEHYVRSVVVDFQAGLEKAEDKDSFRRVFATKAPQP
jgi:hypothetical protein